MPFLLPTTIFLTNPTQFTSHNPLSSHSLTHSPQTPSIYPLTYPSPPIILQHTSNSHSFFTTLIYIKQFVSKLSNNFEEAEVGTRLAVWVYSSAVLDAKPAVNKPRSQCVGVAVQWSCHTECPSSLLLLIYVCSVPNQNRNQIGPPLLMLVPRFIHDCTNIRMYVYSYSLLGSVSSVWADTTCKCETYTDIPRPPLTLENTGCVPHLKEYTYCIHLHIIRTYICIHTIQLPSTSDTLISVCAHLCRATTWYLTRTRSIPRNKENRFAKS